MPSSPSPSSDSLPREGLVATVRNRRGHVTAVTPFDGPDGRLHLVTVDYADLEPPTSETVLWERERGAALAEPRALPDVHGLPAMQPALLDALVRAARWQALTPFVPADLADADADAPLAPRLPIASPFHGAVQVEDYQLEPLLRALQMPRVSLLLADDVGLGKTIEAGLILTELLLRRRIRKVLILTPGSLRDQWQEEMRDKFALHFDVVDRDSTWKLRKRVGLDANPWRTHPRVVASYHYLRQPDVLEQLLATCRADTTAPHLTQARLPWDLLIVDEAHNLMPGPFGADSDLVDMLRQITPYFEHKLFLTATPHNGHTTSFTGLLELLDPVRFARSDELSTTESRRLDDILVRRLKRDIITADLAHARAPRFANRHVQAWPVALSPPELALSQAFKRFKAALAHELARRPHKGQVAGRFALTALEKRLLSCPHTFADSWGRLIAGLADPDAPTTTDRDAELAAAMRAADAELPDDAERESRERNAARTIGTWLRPLADGPHLAAALDAVTAAVAAVTPRDARFDALLALVARHLADPSERLIVFTEYKTTLDYLTDRLTPFRPPGTIARLYGGLDASQRLTVRQAFNDPDSPVRLLIATDAASEGLNLQETARYLLHFDVPWNPSRLEQRNGRLDRHGQARDVTVFHFTSDDDQDLAFLGRVVAKVDRIREDLGAVGEVFDEAFAARFDTTAPTPVDLLERDLDAAIAERRAAVALPTPAASTTASADSLEAEVHALERELDLSPATLAATLATALLRDQGLLAGPDAERLYRLAAIPDRWTAVVDDHLRLPIRGASRGPLPALAFDPTTFIRVLTDPATPDAPGRPVFRARKDTALLHLAHPLYRQVLASLSRLRFETTDGTTSRWTVRRASLPRGLDAELHLTLEELVINDLREPLHHWVRTLVFDVRGRALGPPRPHAAPAPPPEALPAAPDVAAARALFEDLEDDLQDAIAAHGAHVRALVDRALAAGLAAALADARTSMKARKDELTRRLRSVSSDRIAAGRKRALERDLRRLEARRQPDLFAAVDPTARTDDSRVAELRRALDRVSADAAAEARRREARYRELLELLAREERRVLDALLPRRFRLADLGRGVQLHPVALELRLPGHAEARR